MLAPTSEPPITEASMGRRERPGDDHLTSARGGRGDRLHAPFARASGVGGASTGGVERMDSGDVPRPMTAGRGMLATAKRVPVAFVLMTTVTSVAIASG